MNFAIPQTATVPPAATSPAAATRHHKLTDAAQQFEGMLLQELLKPMKEHGLCEDDQTSADAQDGGSGFADVLGSFGTESMATAIAKGGGLGIAKRVVEQVEGESASHNRVTSEPKLHQYQNKIADGTKVRPN